MEINSFMNVAGGIALGDGTLITQGAGGVINMLKDGIATPLLPLAGDGYVSVGVDPMVFSSTPTGFTATDMADPSGAMNFTEIPMGYSGSDGTFISSNEVGGTIFTPDSNLGQSYDLSGDMSSMTDMGDTLNMADLADMDMLSGAGDVIADDSIIEGIASVAGEMISEIFS